jgi:hypothetical protein
MHIHITPPVRNHNHSPSRHKVIKRTLHKLLALTVKSTSSLVQEQDLGVGNNRTRDGDTLFLTATQLGSALATHGVVFLPMAVGWEQN